MSDERRHAHPHEDDDELVQALRAMGADYEPDLAAITRRIDAGRTLAAGNPHPRATVVGRRTSAAVRHGRPVLLPVAAVILVVGGIVLAITPGRPPHAVQNVPAAAIGSNSTPEQTSGPSKASAGQPRVGPAVSITRTSGSTRAITRQPGGTAAARVSVELLGSPPASPRIKLASPPLLDWLIPGARADLKQVRAKIASTAPVITLDTPSDGASVAGAFLLSWRDGAPEQDHTNAAGWLRTGGRTGLSVIIAPADQVRTVTLYAGAADLRAGLAISGPGLTSSHTQLAAPGRQTMNFAITVSLPATTGPSLLQFSGPARGPSPEVYLAAVTVAT